MQVYSIYDKNFDPSWLSDFSIDNVNLETESLQPILDALKAQSKTIIAGVENGVNLPVTDATAINKIETIYQLLMTLTSGGNKGIADITGSDGTSLKDVKDSIQSLNTILQDCKALLFDIRTNTTPTTP